MIEKKGANSDLKWVKDKDQYVDSFMKPYERFHAQEYHDIKSQ